MANNKNGSGQPDWAGAPGGPAEQAGPPGWAGEPGGPGGRPEQAGPPGITGPWNAVQNVVDNPAFDYGVDGTEQITDSDNIYESFDDLFDDVEGDLEGAKVAVADYDYTEKDDAGPLTIDYSDLQMTGFGDPVVPRIEVEADGFMLDGLKVDTEDGTRDGPAIEIGGVEDLTIKNNFIDGDEDNADFSGIQPLAEATSGHVNILDNEVEDGAIGIAGSDDGEEEYFEIVGNEIEGAGDEGIWITGGDAFDGSLEDTTIVLYNNVVEDAGADAEDEDDSPADIKIDDEPEELIVGPEGEDISDYGLQEIATEIIGANEIEVVELWDGEKYDVDGIA